MRTACITYNDVEMICEKLASSESSRITTRMVREEIGRGSLSTISKYVKKWQVKNETSEQPKATVRQLFTNTKFPPRTPVRQACTACTVLYSMVLIAAVIALTRFLVIESAVFYEQFGQRRPIEMSLLTEACLLICAFARPQRKVYLLAVKLMMVAIIAFMMGLMMVGVEGHTQTAQTTTEQLHAQIASIETYNQSLQTSIKELESRSRMTSAEKLQDRMAMNQAQLSELRAKTTTATTFSEMQIVILVGFRIGAIILNVLFAHLLASMWVDRKRVLA